ncbi:MAG: hypothetical protein HY789_12035 [Deltaproteobacteria bacterium]|nr:hypothetical protein [Deltaproteobacteria bacterium]
MSNDSILASFFCGQAGAYAREAGEAEGRLEVVRKRVNELQEDLKNEKASVSGMIEVRKALVEALRELNPNHPLLEKHNRTVIYDAGYENKMKSFNP